MPTQTTILILVVFQMLASIGCSADHDQKSQPGSLDDRIRKRIKEIADQQSTIAEIVAIGEQMKEYESQTSDPRLRFSCGLEFTRSLMIQRKFEDAWTKVLDLGSRLDRIDPYDSERIRYYVYRGTLLVQQGDHVAGVASFQKAERVLAKNPDAIREAFITQLYMALAFHNIGAIDEAIYAGHMAYDLAKQLKSTFYQKSILNNLAQMHIREKRFDEAEEMLERLSQEDRKSRFYLPRQLGLAQIALGRKTPEKALSIIDEFLPNTEADSNFIHNGSVHALAAQCYLAQEKYDLAEEHIKLAVDLINPWWYPYDEALLSYIEILSAQNSRNDDTIKMAIEFINSPRIKDQKSHRKIAKGYNFLAQAYARNGQEKLAIETYQQLAILRLGWNRQECDLRMELSKLRIERGKDQKLAELTRRKAESASARADSHKQNFMILLAAATATIIGLSLYFFKANESRKTKLQLEQAQERAEFQQRLGQKERIEAIGHLTGSVAHDFNNLLQVFSNATVMIDDSLEENRTAQQNLAIESIRNSIETGASITNQLLTFARQKVIDPQPTLVADLFQRAGLLFASASGEEIEVVIEEFDQTLAINVDRAQFCAAILNLLLNARDAMQNRGQVKIQVKQGDKISNRMGFELPVDLQDMETVAIDVADSGIGMTDEQLAQACEPYYTTKSHGTGNGLGLSSVKGFVEQAGGKLCISSQPMRGTRVAMVFPRCSCQASEIVEESQLSDPNPMHNRLLLIEDNPEVSSSTQAMVQNLGFDVASCSNTKDAEQQIQSADFDIILSDIRMPGEKNGAEFARWIAKQYPTVAIVLTSGNQPPPESKDFAFLPKPYTSEQLKRAIFQASALKHSVAVVPEI